MKHEWRNWIVDLVIVDDDVAAAMNEDGLELVDIFGCV